MKARLLVGVVIVGWCLTPSGSIAGTRPGEIEPRATCAAVPVPSPSDRTRSVDPHTGARLDITAKPNGAVQVRMAWTDFEFRKVIQPNGDFSLRLGGSGDEVLLIRTGDRLRVTRRGRTAVFRHTEQDETGFEQVQQVLAGSRVTRMFRALHSQLDEETLASVPGIVVDVTEVQIGVLQGDGGVLERRRPKARGRVVLAGLGGREPCYDEWEREVNIAWVELADCVYAARWFPGGPDACAFLWTIKVEGCFFKYLNCVAFPMRIE